MTLVTPYLPYRDGNFGIRGQVFIEPIKYDILIEQSFGYKETRVFLDSLVSSIREEIQSKVNLIEIVGYDLILQDAVFIDQTLQVDS